MRWWFGVPLTLVIIVGCHAIWQPLIYGVILWSAGWAAWESQRIRAREYKSMMSMGPFGTLLSLLFLWIIGFPAFLNFRSNVLAGRAVRKHSATV
jgi:hypothetical protein